MYQFRPISDRVARLRKRYRDNKFTIDAERALIVTDFIRENHYMPAPLKRANTLYQVCAKMTLRVEDDELIVGNLGKYYKGTALWPETAGIGWLYNELDDGSFYTRKQQEEPMILPDEEKEKLMTIRDFWEEHTMWHGMGYSMPDTISTAVDSGVLTITGSTPNRVVATNHLIPNYKKVIDKGFGAVRAEAQARLDEWNSGRRPVENGDQYFFNKSIVIVCDAYITLARRYAALCLETAEKTADGDGAEAADNGENAEESGESSGEAEEDSQDLYVFIAASLSNAMEEIKVDYEELHPEINIIYNADSSGTLQTQIEEGAQCDLFFSAATKQMDALQEGGYLVDGTVKNLLENKVVLIKPKGGETAVTGFENITEAANLALAGEDVPVGQYAREIFQNLGNYDQVMAMEINEGANVTAVLAAVSEAANELGVVYATDAQSVADSVEVIAQAPAGSLQTPVLYPAGEVKDAQGGDAATQAAEEFLEYLSSPEAMTVFETYGFSAYEE